MIILTIDTDWAPDWATRLVLDKVRALGIKATVFFSTPGPVPAWPGLETGCHPDLSKKSVRPEDLAGDPEADSENRLLAEFRRDFPEAAAVRTHRFYWHSDLARTMVRHGFTIDSSMILPYQPGLRGFKSGRLARFPVWASDHLHLARGHPLDRLEMPNLDREGLKIFCFHVAYLALNAPSLNYFNMVNGGLGPEPHPPHDGPGAWTLFELLAGRVHKSSGGLWLSELAAG